MKKLNEIFTEYQSLKSVDEQISYLEMLSYLPDFKFNINLNSIIIKLERTKQ